MNNFTLLISPAELILCGENLLSFSLSPRTSSATRPLFSSRQMFPLNEVSREDVSETKERAMPRGESSKAVIQERSSTNSTLRDQEVIASDALLDQYMTTPSSDYQALFKIRNRELVMIESQSNGSTLSRRRPIYHRAYPNSYTKPRLSRQHSRNVTGRQSNRSNSRSACNRVSYRLLKKCRCNQKQCSHCRTSL